LRRAGLGRRLLSDRAPHAYAQQLRPAPTQRFGTCVTRAPKTVDMPPPGDVPAPRGTQGRDCARFIWDRDTLPVTEEVGLRPTSFELPAVPAPFAQYLTLVFSALIAAVMVLAIGREVLDYRRPGRPDADGAAAGTGPDRLWRKVEGASACAGRVPRQSPIAIRAAHAQGGRVGARASWLFRVSPYLISPPTLEGPTPRAPWWQTSRPDHGSWSAVNRPLSPLSGQRGASSWPLGRTRCRHQIRRMGSSREGDDRLRGRTRDAHDHVHLGADSRGIRTSYRPWTRVHAIARSGLAGLARPGTLLALIMVAIAERPSAFRSTIRTTHLELHHGA